MVYVLINQFAICNRYHFQVCAINFLFVLAIVIVINFNRNIQIMSINIIAATIALLMVTKMLYQIKYIDHSNWNVNCTVSE